MGDNIKLVIGFIAYGKYTAEYLPYFLPSLVRTTDSRVNAHDYTDCIKILVFDNSEDGENENIKYIKENYPEIEIMREGENLGFANAYNKMIKRAKELGAEYFLSINPDMILEPKAIFKMVEVMDADSNLGAVSPKILKWDFADNLAGSGAGKKTNIVDTCGIGLKPGLRFYDIGQGKTEDDFFSLNQCNQRLILGPSGAAGLYRLSALEKVKQNNQYFDELMFMYKEDCDLAYRLFLAGFESKCVKDAVIYHDRSASAKGEGNFNIALNRKNKNKQVKKWSFLGQQIIFVKYWSLQSFKHKLAIVWHQIKILIFILLFERYLLLELINFVKIQNKIKIYK